MSKRGADHYLTKDPDSYEPRPSADPSRIPKQATAAQLAARKLKAPKGRTANTPQSGNASPAFNNQAPSGSANMQQPHQSQGFGGVNSGTPFGQSVSFPPTNTGSGLQFTPSTTSFSFGAQATNNPFAGVTFGQATSAVAPNAGFMGSGTPEPNKSTQAFNYERSNPAASAPLLMDTPMESPHKQTASQFGGTSQSSLFSAPATSQPPPPTPVFGQSQSAVSSSNNFAFSSQSKGPQPTTFAQSTPSTQPSNLFGKSQTTAQPSHLFGQASSTSQPSTAFNSQTPNMFAQASSISQPSTASISQPSNKFGQPSSTPQLLNGPGPSLAAPKPNFFGTSTSTSQPSNGFAAFTASQTSNFFGPSTSTSQAPHPFGQSTATSQQPTLFGQPTVTANSTTPFVQSPAFTPTPESGLGQSSAAPTARSELYGGASSAISALTGVSSGLSQPGTDAVASQAPTSTSFSNVFSKPADTPAKSGAPSAAVTHTSNFGLGTPTTQTQSNLFGVAPTAKPTSETSTSSPSIFVASSTPVPAQTQAPMSTATPAASTGTKAFNPFGFAATPTPVSPLFGRKSPAGSGNLFDRIKPPTADSEQQIPQQTSVEAARSKGEDSNAGGLSARVSAPAETMTQTFGQQSAQEPERSISPKNDLRPAVEAAAATSAAMPQEEQPAASQTSNLFSNIYAKRDGVAANKEPILIPSDLPQPSELSSISSKPPAAAEAPSTADTATPAGETSDPLGPPPAKSDSSAKATTFKMRSHTMEKPSDLEEYDIQDFDVLARAKGLNVSFQKYIAAVDTSKQDLMPAVLFYVAQRERLGAPVELLEMVHKTGTKRKAEDPDGAQETQKASKRARTEFETVPTTEAPQVYTQGANLSSTPSQANGLDASSTSSNIFKSILESSAPATSQPAAPAVTSSKVANPMLKNPFSSLNSFTPGAVQFPNAFKVQTASGSDSTQSQTSQVTPQSSNLFKSTNAPTPSTSQQPAASQSGSLFQSLSAPSPSTFAQQQATPQTTNIFKPQIESSSPSKSPPKKPVFEMPKFGGSSGTNFMNAFAKQSASSAADLEAEAKRKRKAEEFDSDEDNEEEWERKDAEKQRLKRAKLQALTKAGSGGFQPTFGSKEALQAKAPAPQSAEEPINVFARTSSLENVRKGISDVAVPIPTPAERPVSTDISDDESDGFVHEDTATGHEEDQTLEHDGDYAESSDEDRSSRGSEEEEGDEEVQADAAELGADDDESENEDEDEDDEAYVQDILAKNKAAAKAQADAQTSGGPSLFDRISGLPAEEVVDEEEPYIENILAQNKAAAKAQAQASAGLSLFDRITAPASNQAGTEDKSQADEAERQKPNTNGFKAHAFGTTSTPATTRVPFNRSFRAPATNGVLNSGASSFTPKAPTMSPFTPVDVAQSANASSFTPKAPTMSPFTPINGAQSTPFSAGASVFGPTTKPAAEKAPTQEKTNGLLTFKPSTTVPSTTAGQSVLFGGSTSIGSGPIPGEGLFGSRPSTPNNVDSPTPGGSIFGNLGKTPTIASPENDHTWKRGDGVKFGTPEKDGPAFNVTAATPPAKDESNTKPFSNSFGASTSKPASGGLSVGFNFGGPSASPLLTPSGASSAISSRATSPGGTDTESINTDNGDDHSNDPQTSLVDSRAGEENEEVLFEARAKGSKWFTAEGAAQKKLQPGWNTQGLGPMRVLKHKETGKARVILRADPGSNIVINAGLMESVAYTQKKNNVDFAVYTDKGVERWFLKVKTEEQAKELSAVLEANKKS